MEKHQQMHYKKDTGSATLQDAGSIDRELPAPQGAVPQPGQLDVNGCIRGLARSFSPVVKERIRLQTALGARDLPVMGEPAQIATIFGILVACACRLTPGGSMTILTTLLPLSVGPVSKRTGRGCALLSFRAAGRGGEGITALPGLGRDGLLRALFNVRHIVEKYHGCFRLCLGEADITFNIYLPVASLDRPALVAER